jgi:U3 small nucleolar RNA-associated protein 18
VQVPGISGRSEKSLERFAVSSDGKMTAFTLKGGTVAVVDNRTERTSIQVKMNGTARCVTFAPRPQENSHYLVTSGGDAEVYVWDLRYARGIGSSGTGGHRCLSKWANEGGMPTCGLASSSAYSMFHSSALHSKSNSLRGGPLAVASESGVVNIYHGATDENRGAAPLKCLMNLTTPVETLQFNHDGQLLAMASRWSKNALRIVHLPSATVYSNWPTSKSPLNYVFSLDFSPNSGFLAIGNDKGRVLLYRLRHYSCI